MTRKDFPREPGSLNRKFLGGATDPETLLIAMIDTPGVAVLVHRDYKLLFANDTFAEMMRIPPDGISSWDLSQMVVESRKQEDNSFTVIDKWEAVRKRIEGKYESRLQRHDGSLFWSQMNIKNVNWNGEPARLNIFTDLEPRIAVQEELIRAKADLERANQARSEFLAEMSHELRTPLNAVIGFSDLLVRNHDNNLEQTQIDSLRHINSSGQHLLSLINDVLDLSKMEAGKLELHEEQFHLGDELRRGLVFVRDQARRAKISIEEGMLEDLPVITGDRRLVLQIMVNLLTNAIKYNREGGTVRTLGGINDSGQPWFSISDTGMGMAPEGIEAALRPYGRTGNNGHIEGTGLGLPLVTRMAELHGAKFDINSEPDKGTSASVTFPKHRLPENSIPAA